MQIEIINWQGRKLPEGMDQADKTLFLAPEFPARHSNLILHPLDGDPRSHVSHLSEMLGIDMLTLRGQLTGRGYMALARSDNAEHIARTVATLNAAGYRARMIRDNMFFRIPVPRRVSGLEWSADGGAAFTTSADAPAMAMPAAEPCFLVIADLAAPQRTAYLREHDGRQAPAGAPREFSFHSIVDKTRTYYCDLYFPYQWAAFRIISDNFSYACLSDAAARYSAENLATLLDRLAAGRVQIVWDDRFPETAAFGMRRQIEAAACADKIVTSLREGLDERPFHYYSRLRYLLELASGFKCFV